MKKRYQWLTWAVVLLVHPIYAQEIAPKYSLEQCISLAVKYNYTLDNARKDKGIAHYRKMEAQTKYFPTVTAGAIAFQAHHPALEGTVALPIQGVPAIPVQLFKKGYYGSVTAVQPVYTGGRIIQSNKLAKIGEEASKLQLARTEKQVRETTEDYYWSIINLQEKRKTLHAQAALLKQLQHDVALAVKVGVTNRNDLLRVELQQKRIASGLVTLDHGIDISRKALAQYIGIPEKEDSFQVDMQSFPTIQKPSTYFIPPVEAVRGREGFALLNKQVKASTLEKNIEIGKCLPQVAIGASVEQFNILDQTDHNSTVFATVQVPLTDWWSGSHAIKQKKLAIEKAKNNLKNGRELMELEISQTWNALTEAYDQIQIAKQAIDSSKENLRLNTNTYQAGTTTMADLLDAQMLLQESENQLTEASTQYMIALAKYKRITGQ